MPLTDAARNRPRLPKPGQVVRVALRIAAGLGIPEPAALAFVEDMAGAAMRQLPHDDGAALTWCYQVQARARTLAGLAREAERTASRRP